MLLTDFEFKGSYNRIDDDIAEEFYLPCMRTAVFYDRISGFYGSTVYIIAWDALKDFISNNGKMRIVCSPILTAEDKAALEEGDRAKSDAIIASALVQELQGMLEDENLKTPARLLACLIANKTIELKIAIVKNTSHPAIRNLFHDKTGIFYDSNRNAVGFRGSFNETFKGLSNDGNIESTDVFQSWDGGKETTRITDAANLFERVWNNAVPRSVSVMDIPEALQKAVFDTASKTDIDNLLDEVTAQISSEKKWKPSPKGRTPRKHQQQALDNWVCNGRKGILKHATGSGKTFTAICAIKHALDLGETILVLVPSKELLYHWRDEIKASIPQKELYFLLCGDGNNHWKRSGELEKWTKQNDGTSKIIIAMMSTAAGNQFISRLTCGDHIFVVADEVHRLGSIKRRSIFNIYAGARLGLSATPERYGDSEGTAAIFNYFGGIVPPEYSLEDAIKSGVLTRYFYHPQKVYLDATEQADWDSVTNDISRTIARLSGDHTSIAEVIHGNPYISQLLIRRARILKNATSKIQLALNVLNNNFKTGQKWIVYCDNGTQLHKIRALLEEAGYDAYEYYADMPGDRDETLKYFAAHGGILVSIKCLDEGVDIPSTTHALILASSKNPREFIQRRGRVLRLSNNKSFAHIFDAIVLPARNTISPVNNDDIVLGELARAIQFGTWAENPSCITDLKLISIDYGIDFEEYVTRGAEDDETE